MMYYYHHYVIDWEKVKTMEDVKRLISAMNITFDRNMDITSIQDLVRLEEKPKMTVTLL